MKSLAQKETFHKLKNSVMTQVPVTWSLVHQMNLLHARVAALRQDLGADVEKPTSQKGSQSP